MIRPAFKVLLLVSGMLLENACTQHIHIAKYVVPKPEATGRFLIGAAKVDITPPPGYPMGGHGFSGAFGRGYWTRLYARAFFFEDKQGRTLTLVSCDLFAMPHGLRAEVTRRVSIEAAKKSIAISPSNLIIAATHTHLGPGNYMSSSLFNGFASPLGGFDRQLFDHLADGITRAVCESIKQAISSSSQPHVVRLVNGRAQGLQRNRAVNAFLLNSDREKQLIQPPYDCPGKVDDINCLRYRAIDPGITVLECLRGDGPDMKSIALLVFFAIHPTAMGHDSPLYSSDLTGRAMVSLEREAEAKGDCLIAGFFNGAEGDISPQWLRQDRDDVIRLGDRLADTIRDIRKQAEVDRDTDPAILTAGRDFPVNPAKNETARFAAPPLVGVASLGGAEDGREIFYHYGWRIGVTNADIGQPHNQPNPRGAQKQEDCEATGAPDQGVKQPALDLPNVPLLRQLKLTRLLASPGSFPHFFPVSVARIGNVITIGAIPVEMTTTMGDRIRDHLLKAGPHANPRFVLIGLANEYIHYTTTPEEYGAQDYEGASTYFGPQQGPMVCHLLKLLLDGLSNRPADTKQEIQGLTFNAGGPPPFGLHFGPELLLDRAKTLDQGLEMFMHDSTGRLDLRPPRYAWYEDSSTDWLTGHRRVTILEKRSGQWRELTRELKYEGETTQLTENDEGGNVLTLLVSPGKQSEQDSGKRRWAAIWIPPRGEDQTAEFMFMVTVPLDSRPRCSIAFTLGALGGKPPVYLEDGPCPAIRK